ncbi:P-loop ATPase, Sll1717 family [Pediococcus pentosaceus]|uniref:P-loop ATPase, Sll1717 family n=1 Tax=Pediococcus pentosaceus TaxID=1255 RepID=UPI001E343F1C|nr:hypothetical protein [Pediococcus pentosaceus]MCG7196503.1 hypothetical protein [Pediococcus pentosaceus]MCI2396175.1 hypothetical protein [Pediococcus pentosaceus]
MVTKLEDFEFGYADAEKEYNRMPQIFGRSFYDYRHATKKLISGNEFLLVGRKGVGKSAFNSRIRFIGSTNNTLYAFPLQLNDFEYTTFAKASVDKDVTGTQKYKASWDFFLMISIIRFIKNNSNIKLSESMLEIIRVLEKLKFKVNEQGTTLTGSRQIVKNLSKLKLGGFGVEVEVDLENLNLDRKSSFSDITNSLNDVMFKAISDTLINETKSSLMMLDGIDDILRLRRNHIEILASLIRSVDYLNEKFFINNIKSKIIICIREDILNMLNDPDLNKIRRDSSILIDWSSDIKGLREVVNLRFNYTIGDKSKSNDVWDDLFPKKFKKKTSWEHVLSFTLFKPRDVIQFLKTCQELFPTDEKLSYSQVRQAIKSYSKDYLIEEMKNEVAGFVGDELITLLPTIFQKIGSRDFSYNEFVSSFKSQGVSKTYDESELKKLLSLLFEAGYIGQLVRVSNKYNSRTNTSVIFKHRNPGSQVDFSQKFIIHTGLTAGLGVRLN